MNPSQPDALLVRVMGDYARAWETYDADFVLTLFTEDATYQENPFSEPMTGHAAIRNYWEGATRQHRDVQFRWEFVSASCGLRVIEWSCSFRRTDVAGPIELRGIMLIEFRGERIFRFRECWVRRQNGQPG
jgi:ketosteroid isomerase-like protein